MKTKRIAFFIITASFACVLMLLPGIASAVSMVSPIPGSTFTSTTVTFTWQSDGMPVTAYWLWVGPCNSQAWGGCGDDFFNSGNLGLSTSRTVSGLPDDGSAVFARIWYQMGGAWNSTPVYSYTAWTKPAAGCGVFIPATICPIGAADGPTCDKVPVGAFCEGDGECGTNINLDNCTATGLLYDWYLRTQ